MYWHPPKTISIFWKKIQLSDVTLGGETVFPRLKIKVKPVKGSIVMWTNMRVDGDEEPFTHHTGCPVVVGTKISKLNIFDKL